ncbi:MAG: acyl-CoA dehydrogenase family protein [Burkholderiaceae bacterium]
MDLNFSSAEIAFRDEVRAFFASKLPTALKEKVRKGQHPSKSELQSWWGVLNQQGWLAPHWPKEYRGTGWNVVERFIYDTESALAHAPSNMPFGVMLLGPVLIKFGTDAQKKHWLPRILDGSDWWCQGYSEPGAGSDLAALKTSAVRATDANGEHYIINGQKTWTSYAQHANMMFCLVRTKQGKKKQEGISFLLIDMNTPGIEVRPIITLDGAHEVNEVFFTDVRVPVENLVGEEDRGWDCAKYLLTFERTTAARVGLASAELARLKTVAAQRQRNGRPWSEDPLFAARLARVEIALENMKTTNMRVVAAVASGGAPGVESSILKLCGSQIRQEISALALAVMGVHARAFIPDTMEDVVADAPFASTEVTLDSAHYFNKRKLSIFGGSDEIQKNIISKMILGL